MGRWSDEWWPPPSRPRPAKGGIRSRSRRGAFAESWWGKRWIEVLEGFPIGNRLRRGRSYARSGQVLEVTMDPGRITARVQGSRAQPYRVEVELEPLSAAERRGVSRALARRPRLQAALLAGEMPPDVEETFREAGVPLFPEEGGDLATDCSCPDWSNPCKHVAAVYYLVSEELDRNPFLLLRLRGLGPGDVAAAGSPGEAGTDPLEDPADASAGSPVEGRGPGRADRAEAASSVGPPSGLHLLPADPERFWGVAGALPHEGAEGSADQAVGGAAEQGHADGEERWNEDLRRGSAHLRLLGRVPFWRGETDPDAVLAEMVRRAVSLGTEVLAGEASEDPEVDG